MTLARFILALAALYAAAGAVFTPLFIARGLRRVDPATATARWTFLALIAPGLIALWPLMLAKWGRASRTPAPEHA